MDAQRGIARRLVVGLPPEGASPAWERDFAAYPPAGVIIFRRDFHDLESLRRLTSRLRELAGGRRIFIGIDEEGGFVSQLGDLLVVPPNALLLARGAGPGDLEWIARGTGERLRALGIDWDFAPVADVHSRPENPVIGPRSFGHDPESVSRRIGEVLRGFRAAGLAGCLKHFPGHGDTVLDSHVALPRCEAALAELEARELVPFRNHLEADAVMTAHVVYPALDTDQPGTFSGAVTTELLRGRLGFQGVAITDALEMKGAAEGRSLAERGRLALEAGSDLLLYAFHDDDLRRARLELARALVEGGLDRGNFDAARPRLERLAHAIAPPTEAELSRPLEDLTPPDWVARLEKIATRGLAITGALPPGVAGGSWRVSEPPFPQGPALAQALAGRGVPVSMNGDQALEVVVVMTRLPLAAAELERLREGCRRRPTCVVGLQSDAFLDHLPEAALRISAADATPLTRGVVAHALATRYRAAAEARA